MSAGTYQGLRALGYGQKHGGVLQGLQAVWRVGTIIRSPSLPSQVCSPAVSRTRPRSLARVRVLSERRIPGHGDDCLAQHLLVAADDGLFPALAPEFPDQIAVLEAEHRRIEAVLAEAAAGPPEDPAWPGRLAETLAELREHIFKEQDGVFPAALASLRNEDWEAVEAARARAGSLLRRVG